MVGRLVVGYSAVGHTVVEALRDRADDLVVVTADTERAETLRADGIHAILVKTVDRNSLATVAADLGSVDIVAVLGSDPTANIRAARAARQVLPDAYLFAYVGEDAGPATREQLAAVADRTYQPGAALLEHVATGTETGGSRLRQLRGILADFDGPLAIVTHDNPDPDAIASAQALARVASAFGVSADVCYFGEVSHQENRALVNHLDLDLLNLEPGADLEAYGGVALVDHARPGVNDGLPAETPIDIVIDHHPPRGPVNARYLDLRSDVGATSTLLVDYLRQLGLAPESHLATALLFGIRVDTQNFARETSSQDITAAAYLLEFADLEALERIESPSVGTETIRLLAEAITNRRVRDGILTTCVGSVADRDALAQAADHLLNMAGVSTTLVYGVTDGTVYLSARARGSELDLGETLRDAFTQVGTAGGHADMAGAQIEVGMLVDANETDEKTLREIVDAVVRDRFFEVVATRDGRPVPTAPADAGGEYTSDIPE